MGPSDSLCSRCGGTERIEVGPHESRCADCGLGSRSVPLRAVAGTTPPNEGIARLAEMKARMAQQFADAPFAPYALDARWAGLRSFGGCGGSNGGIDHLTLAHGDVSEPTAVQARVETRRPRPIGLDGPRDRILERSLAARELVGSFWRLTGTLPDDVRAAAFPVDEPAPFSRVPTAPWADATIAVAAEPIAFKVLTDGDAWVALGEVGDLLIGITAIGWPIADTGLAPVTDFAVYAAGSKEIEARMRRRHTNPDA